MEATGAWDAAAVEASWRKRARSRAEGELGRISARYLLKLHAIGEDPDDRLALFQKWRQRRPELQATLSLHEFARALSRITEQFEPDTQRTVDDLVALSAMTYPHVPDLVPLEVYLAAFTSAEAMRICGDEMSVTWSALGWIISAENVGLPFCTFGAAAFRIALPGLGDRGLPEYDNALDNRAPCPCVEELPRHPGDSAAASELRRFLGSVGFHEDELGLVDAFAAEWEMTSRFEWSARSGDRTVEIRVGERRPDRRFDLRNGLILLRTEAGVVRIALNFDVPPMLESLRESANTLGHFAQSHAALSRDARVIVEWEFPKRGRIQVGQRMWIRASTIAETLSIAYGIVVGIRHQQRVQDAAPAVSEDSAT